MTTSHLADVDYFTDAAITQHPYDYWDELRRQGPVVREPHHGVVAVTGYQEVQTAFKDVEAFSAVNAIGGPFPPLPFTPDGDDISELIAAHRHEFPIFEHMVVMDPPEHGKARSLLSRYPNITGPELDTLIEIFPKLPILDAGLVAVITRCG